MYWRLPLPLASRTVSGSRRFCARGAILRALPAATMPLYSTFPARAPGAALTLVLVLAALFTACGQMGPLYPPPPPPPPEPPAEEAAAAPERS